MGKLTRKKSELRKSAVLQFFLEHPAATGDEAQELLMKGKLTGEPGPSLSVGMLYELRKRALAMLPTTRAVRPAAGTAPVEASFNGEQLAAIREHARALQEALRGLPSVAEVIITRDGARVVRLEPREEPL